MYKIVFLIISLFFITGCVKTNEQPQIISLPSWYLNAPTNNNNTLYGVGEGQSLNEAKINGLKNMSENLVVTVQSSLNSITTTNGNEYNKKMVKDIKVEAKKITFSNYKVDKAVQNGNKFYVLLSVDRKKLFNEKQKELNSLDYKIDENLKALNNKEKLLQIYTLKQNLPLLNKAKNTSFVLYAINNNFDYQKYYKKYDTYINKINILKNGLKIKINFNTNENLYAQSLKTILTKNNYKISNNNPNVIINIKNNIRESHFRGWTIVKVSSLINVIVNNKTISNNTINTIGRSSSTKENSIASSAKQFKAKLEDLTLDKLLFNK